MNLNHRILRLGLIIPVLLGLVSLRMVYWGFVRGPALQPVAVDPAQAAAEYERLGQLGQPTPTPGPDGETPANPGDLQSLPQPVIQRTAELLSGIRRGSIFDRRGVLLAGDHLASNGERFRTYEDESLGHLLGYVSGIRTGVSGLELTYNETLLGLDRPDTQLRQMIQLQEPIIGSDLILTIDSQVQQAAAEALGERAGAVVVLDAHTGGILAMVTAPRFDPNRMLDANYVAALVESAGSPLLNRATQGAYTPGSTWKTVTLIAALDSGLVTPETVFDFGKAVNGVYYYEVDGGRIPDPNHKEARLSLPLSYARSANAAFARMGDELGPDAFIQYAGALGFGAPGQAGFPLEIEYRPSQLASDLETFRSTNLLQAATAIGQGELLTTPLNMAMVVLPVLNGGDLPLPHLVDAIHAPSGRETGGPMAREVVRNLFKETTAAQVREMMIAVVQDGAGAQARVRGATVGGKTGTAQLPGDQPPHAWFTGFAERGEHAVVIAVLVENGGSGASVAAPIFAQVAAVALDSLAAPETIEAPQEGRPLNPSALSPDIALSPAELRLTVNGRGACPPAEIQVSGVDTLFWPSDFRRTVGDDFLPRHPGLDLSSPPGGVVFAAAQGQVVFSGWSTTGYGNAIVLDHGGGLQTLYAHLSKIYVRCGELVTPRQTIGLSGNTGNSYGPHLHFEIRLPDGFIDPIGVLTAP